MPTLKDELKALIVRKGQNVTSLAELLTKSGHPTSKQNLNNKLSNETIRYKEILEIADVLGYEIKWVDKV
ncbi:MAG: DUF6471 domain-containing protein [Candidatus Gastranaerophilales bacterium]|nr:DUF6471 domain-containing protein [Candidatus Gastranaerophilales bacterium]MCM1072240.1 DUF6471 domain-containing protein [Bacteroides sp.]